MAIFCATVVRGLIHNNIIYGQKATESNQKIFAVRGIANGLETELTFKETWWKCRNLQNFQCKKIMKDYNKYSLLNHNDFGIDAKCGIDF